LSIELDLANKKLLETQTPIIEVPKARRELLEVMGDVSFIGQKAIEEFECILMQQIEKTKQDLDTARNNLEQNCKSLDAIFEDLSLQTRSENFYPFVQPDHIIDDTTTEYHTVLYSSKPFFSSGLC